MMKVAAYTGGRSDPSARTRIRHYIPRLAAQGIAVREHPLPYGHQVPRNKLAFLPWGIATVAQRSAQLIAGRVADASWICRQLLPLYLNLEVLARKPIVLDVDDAIWMTRGGHRVAKLARASAKVVCGNTFLAEKFATWNSNVTIISTSIDTGWYAPAPEASVRSEAPVIGWTGTHFNFPYLYSIEPALLAVMQRYPAVKVLIVANEAPKFSSLPPSRVEFVKFSLDAEKSAMARMSIGIMPMDNSDWARGKCANKMICYMSCALPVVVTPVGMNAELLAQGSIGFGAESSADWVDAFSSLIEDPDLRFRMGVEGRRIVEAKHAVDVLSRDYVQVFQALQGAAA